METLKLLSSAATAQLIDDGFTQSFHDKSNINGILLTELINEHNLICLNTKFQKKSGKKWTFQYPNGAKAQIDFILINRKWCNGATNCEVYNTFCCVGSDHRIVSAHVHLSLRANKIKRELLTDKMHWKPNF